MIIKVTAQLPLPVTTFDTKVLVEIIIDEMIHYGQPHWCSPQISLSTHASTHDKRHKINHERRECLCLYEKCLSLYVQLSVFESKFEAKSHFISIKLHITLSLRSYKVIIVLSSAGSECEWSFVWEWGIERGNFKSFVDTIILLLWDSVLVAVSDAECSFIRKFIKPWPIKASYLEQRMFNNGKHTNIRCELRERAAFSELLSLMVLGFIFHKEQQFSFLPKWNTRLLHSMKSMNSQFFLSCFFLRQSLSSFFHF